MLDRSVIEEVLRAALSRGGSFAEIFAEERESATIHLDDGKIEELTSGLDRGAGVRVVHGEASAYAYSNRLDPEALLEAARAASASVRDATGEAPEVLDLTRAQPEVVHRAERPAVNLPPQTKVDWLWEADDAARSLDPSVRQVVASYGDSLQRVLIASSDGRLVEEERPRIRFVVQFPFPAWATRPAEAGANPTSAQPDDPFEGLPS